MFGNIYQHFKGNIYVELTRAVDSETQEEVVVYYQLSEPDKIWTRPAKMFDEEVEKNGVMVPRFRKTGGIITLPAQYYQNDSSPCDACGCNPKNGGSGICNCTLGGPTITC